MPGDRALVAQQRVQVARLVEQLRELVERGRRIGVGAERGHGLVGRHGVRREQLRPGALLGAELAQPQLAAVLEPHEDPRRAVAQRGARVEQLKAPGRHEVDQQRQVARPRPPSILPMRADAVELAPGERVERGIERLQRHEARGQRRLHSCAGDAC